MGKNGEIGKKKKKKEGRRKKGKRERWNQYSDRIYTPGVRTDVRGISASFEILISYFPPGRL